MSKHTELFLQASSSKRKLEHVPVNNDERNTPNQKIHPKNFGNISQRFMCSANITRNSIGATVNYTRVEEDDEAFFHALKNKIHKHLSVHSKENYEPVHLYQKPTLLRKKNSTLDEETQNVINRFRKDTQDKPVITVANIHSKNSISNTNILKPQTLQIDCRNTVKRPSEFLFHMTTKKQKQNHIESSANETTVVETEIEELLFCELECFTPRSTDWDAQDSIT